MFAQRRNRLTTHFSERIPVVKRRITVLQLALRIRNQKNIFVPAGKRPTIPRSSSRQPSLYADWANQLHIFTGIKRQSITSKLVKMSQCQAISSIMIFVRSFTKVYPAVQKGTTDSWLWLNWLQYSEIMWNTNLMQIGNFIDVFLARHVSGTYAHHQEH